MNILIGKPEGGGSSSYMCWPKTGYNTGNLNVSHGSYYTRDCNTTSFAFWSINNCMLGISIDISIGTPEYAELSGLMSAPNNIDEEDINIYATSLILKYIKPSQLLICIENESIKQFRLGKQDKLDEIKLAMSRLGF